jgi:carboxylesterase
MKTGVFLIHGLFGSPREYLPLLPVLKESGFRTRTVSLLGHGEYRHLSVSKVNPQEMIAHLLDQYNAFAQECEQVVIVGHSLGGVCSLILAGKQPVGLAGLVSIAAPYDTAYMLNRWQYLKLSPATLAKGLRHIPDYFHGLERPVIHLKTMKEVRNKGSEMLSILQAAIPAIEQPVCLMHSPYDLTIPYGQMDKLATQLAQNTKTVVTHTLLQCGHQIYPKSGDTHRVTQQILHFIHHHVHPLHQANRF